jgi:phage gpG-like protein
VTRSLELEIREQGSKLAALHVAQLGERAGNPRPAFERIGREMQREEARYFQSRGAGKWPPLAMETEAIKSAEGSPSQPLVASGRLRDSLVGHGAVKVTPHSVGVGTDVPYARFHEYGTASMPKRPPVVPASPRLNRMARDEVSRYVVKGQA